MNGGFTRKFSWRGRNTECVSHLSDEHAYQAGNATGARSILTVTGNQEW